MKCYDETKVLNLWQINIICETSLQPGTQECLWYETFSNSWHYWILQLFVVNKEHTNNCVKIHTKIDAILRLVTSYLLLNSHHFLNILHLILYKFSKPLRQACLFNYRTVTEWWLKAKRRKSHSGIPLSPSTSVAFSCRMYWRNLRMTQGEGLDICVLGLRAFSSYLCRVVVGKSRGQFRQIWWRALCSLNSAMLLPRHLSCELLEFCSTKSPTGCNNFPVYYPDVYLQLNMFRAFPPPIIRRLMTAVAASGFTFVSWW
jgi:hypothetical protein